MNSYKHIVCCHECDELVSIHNPSQNGRFICPECGSLLFRHKVGMIEKMYALSLSALILFAVTNYFPFLSFEVTNNVAQANFFTSVIYLSKDGEYLLALAILMTTIVVPLLRIVLFLMLFIPLYHKHIPSYSVHILKMLQHSTPWGMLDVFLIGILVSIVKLVKMGHIIAGTSVWAFVVLVFVMAYMQITYNPHHIWDLIDRNKDVR
jgi:paraquat-inducible protein A